MAMNDPIGDMLTRIRNAQMRRRPKVSSPASTLRARVLDVLTEEGYIRGYTRVEPKGGLPELEIELKYYNGQPAIKEIERISKPASTLSAACAFAHCGCGSTYRPTDHSLPSCALLTSSP